MASVSCCGIPYYPELETLKPNTQMKSNLHKLLHEDQPFVWSGWRRAPIESLSKCVYSLFNLHNETMNIWTHLLPIFLWIYYMLDIYRNPVAFTTSEDTYIFIAFLICSTCTMLFSALYHTFRSQNEDYYHWFLSCDLRGILIMLVGCNLISSHFELRCYRKERAFYIIFILFCFISLALWVTKMVRERLTKQRTVYFAFFSFIGFTAWMYKYHHSNGSNSDTYWPMGYSYLSIGTALVIRALRLPEKLVPYKFDIFGASHQIFHTIVIFSAWILVYGYRKLLNQGRFEC